MYKQQGQFYYSPSDLTCFMESPFASWMERFALEYPDQAPPRDPEDSLLEALAERGRRQEERLEAAFGAQGLQVVKITGDSLTANYEQTCAAMAAGIDVIVQARLAGGGFGGYSDFLLKLPGESRLGDYHYEIWDSKLATTVKPTFLVQLCCYAQMLETMQGRRPTYLTVALGNGERQRFKTLECYAYYQSLKAAFLEAQQSFNPEKPPDPADSSNWGNWSKYAEQLLLANDHLLQVATITRGQIKKLNQAGIYTMTSLATSDRIPVRGINPKVLERLKAQAAIQVQTKKQQQAQRATTDRLVPPCFEVLKPADGEKTGLALLPPHSDLDLFFDIEGYPLTQGGLEYLWGATYFDADGKRTFRDFWAHNQQQEKQAFQAFIEWAYHRWQQDPTMHIYHYASYEITACRKLMGRYGICEHEVDQLLRNEVFVDLFKIVRSGILLGEPRYSIKNVEHLYRGNRETVVGTGGDSVVVYERWRQRYQAGEEGDRWQSSAILRSIREYNIDDCNSTEELTKWLRQQQQQLDIRYLGNSEVVTTEQPEEITERTRLRDQLLLRAKQENTVAPEQAKLTENLAWVLEFHRREAKPVFWRLFDRLGLSHLDLIDDLDCLAHCQRTGRAPFKPTAKARNLAYEYHFDSTQEFKGAAKHFYLLGVDTEDGGYSKVTYLDNCSDLENGLIVIQAKHTPPNIISLIPDEYVNPNPIPQAIEHCVRAYEQGNLTAGNSNHPQAAIIDFLTRAKPRFKTGLALSNNRTPNDSVSDNQIPRIAPSRDPGERLQQIIQAVRHLDNSYLTIQGPPGAGKSYTAKHIITELVRAGARVGIASNSHKAINNLLLSTTRYCQQQGILVRAACTRETDAELAAQGITIVNNNKLAQHLAPGCILGTTAWGFARDELARQLDYLFVDEAGQVAVANLIAMSRAAHNLVLIGDQMQLGQPSQGTHPAESGLSVLDYLLHETPTIPEEMGVFLGTTYRMHSCINHFISEHIYEGKLVSHPDNDRRIIEVPNTYRQTSPKGPLNREAGIIFVPVTHEGNSQCADEEVAVIHDLAHQLLGRIRHTGSPQCPAKQVSWDDMLFVAPYNHQVSKLKQALGEQAKVGSVDKFQGQEAPIVFLSMCASNPAESPRGLAFLFDKHRLNVAISRAQTLAIIVANPAIGRIPVSGVEQLRLVNLFNALTVSGSSPLPA